MPLTPEQGVLDTAWRYIIREMKTGGEVASGRLMVEIEKTSGTRTSASASGGSGASIVCFEDRLSEKERQNNPW